MKKLIFTLILIFFIPIQTAIAAKNIPPIIKNIILSRGAVYANTETKTIKFAEELDVIDVTKTHVVTKKGLLNLDEFLFVKPSKPPLPFTKKAPAPQTKKQIEKTNPKKVKKPTSSTKPVVTKQLLIGKKLFQRVHVQGCTGCHGYYDGKHEQSQLISTKAIESIDALYFLMPEKNFRQAIINKHDKSIVSWLAKKQKKYNKKHKTLTIAELEIEATNSLYSYFKVFFNHQIPDNGLKIGQKLKAPDYQHNVPSLKLTKIIGSSQVDKTILQYLFNAKIAIQEVNRDKAIKYISKAIKLHNNPGVLYRLNNVLSSLNVHSSYLPDSLPLLEKSEERLKFTINSRNGK